MPCACHGTDVKFLIRDFKTNRGRKDEEEGKKKTPSSSSWQSRAGVRERLG